MDIKEFKNMIFENIKNNKEWILGNVSEINGGLSEDDIDEIFTYKKGNDELVIESNIYNENGANFKYNGEYLSDNELLYLLEEKQLINMVEDNLYRDFDCKRTSGHEQLDESLISEYIEYKKDNLEVRITTMPGDIKNININNKEVSREELIEFINKLFNTEKKQIESKKDSIPEKISMLQKLKDSLLGQKTGKKR